MALESTDLQVLIVGSALTILLAAHLWHHGSNVFSMFEKLAIRWAKPNERLEAAVLEAGVQQYLATAKCGVHLAIMGSLGLAWECYQKPSSEGLLHVATFLAAWVYHHLVSIGRVEVSSKNLRLFVLLHDFLVGFFVCQTAPAGEYASVITAVKVMTRLVAAVISADLKTTIPSQCFISAVEVYGAWKRDPNSAFLYLEPFLLAAILTISGFLEFSTRDRIATLLESESLALSVRRMLRGVCDGELLLDQNFQIEGKAECLKSLLSSDDFSGMNFEQLLVEDERPQFRRFMLGHSLEATGDMAPPCLRVSLKRANVRVGVDMFHVKMPHTFGEACHLVALREDCETRSPPEVTEEAETNDDAFRMLRKSDATSPPSESSISRASQVSANSILQICRNLSEMTLLVDPQSPLLDVEQAHLSFVHCKNEAMPSLRRLIQPTDWGAAHQKLLDFASGASSTGEVLQTKWRLQDDAKRSMAAHYLAATKTNVHYKSIAVRASCTTLKQTSIPNIVSKQDTVRMGQMTWS